MEEVKLKCKEIWIRPKYGMFWNNKHDRFQINDMTLQDYMLVEESCGSRIWIKK